MWIEFTEDKGPHKKGQRIDKEDAAAKTLIELGIAKASEAPKTEPDPETPVLGDVIAKAVDQGINKLKKELEPITKRFADPGDDEHAYTLGTAKKLTLPANAKKWSTPKSFSGTGDEKYAKAYRFGMFVAAVYGKKWARKWCENNGVILKTFEDDVDTKDQDEHTNISSAVLVGEEFAADIIDLREKYGVARKECKIVPMTSDIRRDPRRRDGIPVYFVGEAATGTKGDKQWDQVTKTARKLMALSKFSSEISEDAIINVGDDIADEFAYAMALREDQCWYGGDGTQNNGSVSYGGIIGLQQAFLNQDTIANLNGAVVGAAGTGAAWTGFTLPNFNTLVGTLPEYADGNAKFYCSKAFWGSVMQRLATAAGGNRVGEITGGARVKEFLGYEVVISQVFPKTAAVNNLVCVFGDMRRAVDFGVRREITLGISNSALNAFEQDQTVLRATERFDIVVHDVGDSSSKAARSTQAGKVAGPIVGLWTASS